MNSVSFMISIDAHNIAKLTNSEQWKIFLRSQFLYLGEKKRKTIASCKRLSSIKKRAEEGEDKSDSAKANRCVVLHQQISPKACASALFVHRNFPWNTTNAVPKPEKGDYLGSFTVFQYIVMYDCNGKLIS